MADPERIISLAERLKSRREELGLSQAQAARELDVARTAYRLWEMEAARPSPDRWRLIASWLGVSVTSMLLAEELVSEEEAVKGELIAADFGRSGRDWDAVGASKTGTFFSQARSLIEEAIQSGSISADQAAELTFVLERIENDASMGTTDAWMPAELRRTFAPRPEAARAAREAVEFVAADIPAEHIETARLLVSELVTNSVVHGPREPRATVELQLSVDRDRLRIEVADSSSTPARLRTPGDEGGYGLTLVDALASRWDAHVLDGRNVTWFELDLPHPGRFP